MVYMTYMYDTQTLLTGGLSNANPTVADNVVMDGTNQVWGLSGFTIWIESFTKQMHISR